MECPKDKSVLKSRIYEGEVEVDACPSCHGMWLDNKELEQIQEIHEHDYSEELKRMSDLIGPAYEMARQQALPMLYCPKCNAEMSKHEYAYCSQVMIDVCPKCQGIWLDNGEIKRLEVFFERSRMETRDIRKGFLRSLPALFQD